MTLYLIQSHPTAQSAHSALCSKVPNLSFVKSATGGRRVGGQTLETGITKDGSRQVHQPGAHIFLDQVRSGMSERKPNTKRGSWEERELKAKVQEI